MVDPSAWVASDWKGRQEEFTLHLTPADLVELNLALAIFKSSGLPRTRISQSVFPLNSLAEKLRGVLKDVRDGKGFFIIRSVPISSQEPLDILTLNLGINCYFGNTSPVSGSLATHVRRMPDAMLGNKMVMRSHGSAAAGLHTDAGGDILGLICINQAHNGGVSSFCSAIAIHNEFLRRGREDVVRTLAEDSWTWDLAKFHPDGANAFTGDEERFVRRPIFSYHEGFLSVVYTQSFREPGAPELTTAQHEALNLLEEIASSDDFRLELTLQRGDLLLMSNYTILHARSHYEDTPEEPRHLVRTWIELPDGERPVPDHVANFRKYSPLLKRPEGESDLRSGSSKFLLPSSGRV